MPHVHKTTYASTFLMMVLYIIIFSENANGLHKIFDDLSLKISTFLALQNSFACSHYLRDQKSLDF